MATLSEDLVLSIEEAAQHLEGSKPVDLYTVYHSLRRGRLPGSKVGQQWRIRKSDLDRFLARALLAGEEERKGEV